MGSRRLLVLVEEHEEGRAREQLEANGATALLGTLSPQAGERDLPPPTLWDGVTGDQMCALHCRARAGNSSCPCSGPSPRPHHKPLKTTPQSQPTTWRVCKPKVCGRMVLRQAVPHVGHLLIVKTGFDTTLGWTEPDPPLQGAGGSSPCSVAGQQGKEATAQPLCRQCEHGSATHQPPELGVPARPCRCLPEIHVCSIGSKAPSLDGGMMGRPRRAKVLLMRLLWWAGARRGDRVGKGGQSRPACCLSPGSSEGCLPPAPAAARWRGLRRLKARPGLWQKGQVQGAPDAGLFFESLRPSLSIRSLEVVPA